MNTTTTIKNQSTEIGENDVAIMVYYTSRNTWRGFVHPYNITTELNTKSEVVDKLRLMKEVYEKMLEEYNYPDHLCKKRLTNKTDLEFYYSAKNQMAIRGATYIEIC